MKRAFLPSLCLLLALAACSDLENVPTAVEAPDPQAVVSSMSKNGADAKTDNAKLVALLNDVNAKLAEDGAPVRVGVAEYLTAAESGRMGQVVFANDRGNKQLAHDFVPADPRRGFRTDITYYVDENRPSVDVDVAASTAAIDRAMATWDEQTCSELELTKNPYDGGDTGYIAAALGFGGSLDVVADVNHAGWLPGDFFDLLAPDGSSFILGVTATIWFVNNQAAPTDIDNDGKIDVAFREIYYNDAFAWAVGGHFDIETVALHEAGHGLSQAHFGKIFGTVANGVIHFAPLAVMNAAYSQIQHDLKGTDSGGHCSNWGSWPNT